MAETRFLDEKNDPHDTTPDAQVQRGTQILERGTEMLPAEGATPDPRREQKQRFVEYRLRTQFGSFTNLPTHVQKERERSRPSKAWGQRRIESSRENLNRGFIPAISRRKRLTVRQVVEFLGSLNVSLSQEAVRELRGDGTPDPTLFTLLATETLSFIARTDSSWLVLSKDHPNRLWVFESSGYLTLQRDDVPGYDPYEDALFSLRYVWKYDKTERGMRARLALCDLAMQAINECVKLAESDFDSATFVVEKGENFSLYHPTLCVNFHESSIHPTNGEFFVRATKPAPRIWHTKVLETAKELLEGEEMEGLIWKKAVSKRGLFIRDLLGAGYDQAIVETSDGVSILFTPRKYVDVRVMP